MTYSLHPTSAMRSASAIASAERIANRQTPAKRESAVGSHLNNKQSSLKTIRARKIDYDQRK